MEKTSTMEKSDQVGIYERYPPSKNRIAEGGKRVSSETGPHHSDLPLVSIITVVRDGVETIQRCIDSVQNQSYRNVEHIVIDGESTDGTLDIIKRNESALGYFISEPDSGIYSAMNKGIRLAQGRYISMINSDDWLLPDGITKLASALAGSNADLAIGYANFFNEEEEHFHTSMIGNFDDRILISGMSFCHQAVLADRACFEAVGLFDESLRLSGDYKWIRELFLSGKTAVFVEEPVVNFSYTGLTKTHRPVMKEEAKSLLCDTFDFVRPEEAHILFEWVYRDGPLSLDLLPLFRRGRQDEQFQISVSTFLLQRLIEAEENLKKARSRRQSSIRTDSIDLLRRIKRKLIGYLKPGR